MHVLYLLIYVVFGIFMIVLSLALYDRLKAGSPALAQAVTTFGMIFGRPGHCERHDSQSTTGAQSSNSMVKTRLKLQRSG